MYTLWHTDKLPTIISGDINIHHILTQPNRQFNSYKLYLSNLCYQRLYNTDFIIANKAGVITRWSNSLSKHDSCIDLTFFNSTISNYIASQQTISESTGLDHSIIYTYIKSPFVTTYSLIYNRAYIDQKLTYTELKCSASMLPPIERGDELFKKQFNQELNSVTVIFTQNTPIS